MSLTRVNLKQAEQFAEICMRARVVPYIAGSPGIN